jgi:acyl-coenzyme A thioesterase PaaI-like protein
MTRTSASGHDTKHVRIAKNHCFACGPDNPDGMHLKFRFDERAGRAWCRFRLPLRFQGPPGHAHGGIIATILDEAMGKVNKLRSVIAVTKTMDVEYLKLVPLRKSLIVEGRERSVRGRKHVNVAEIMNDKGEVLARSRGLFIAIDPARMFAKHLRPGEHTGPAANADGVRKKPRKVVK